MQAHTQPSRSPATRLQQTRPWQPLLEGDCRALALQAVQEIADGLRESRSRLGMTDFSLAGGSAGLAVFFAYLHQAFSEPAATPRGFLEAAIAAAREGPTRASLYSGLAGVGWAATHLQDGLAGLDVEDITADIDEALDEHLGVSHWLAEYDLIDGLVGFGVHALERLPRPAAAACLGRVVEHLAGLAEPRPEGVTWWTPPDGLIPEQRQRYPRGYYNLGLAHGVPGVIALLGGACAAGVAPERARPLLDGAVHWLLAQRMAEGPAAFSCFVGPDVAPTPARLAWCYGDLGVALALLGAARAVGEEGWEQAALTIARRAAARPLASGVIDAGLCHGAAGVGHLFNRLFQAKGEECFAEAARFWLQRALSLRQPGYGIAGYLSWVPGPGGAMTWLAEPGLLTGAAGVGLALLAAATTLEPAWDRLLLVSLAPATA
jgi:hypothetical protein